MNTLNILVSNHFGVLTKVSSLFGRRGVNIDSLTVFPTREDPLMSRITVTALGQLEKIEQIRNQLEKLEDVKHVALATDDKTMYS